MAKNNIDVSAAVTEYMLALAENTMSPDEVEDDIADRYAPIIAGVVRKALQQAMNPNEQYSQRGVSKGLTPQHKRRKI